MTTQETARKKKEADRKAELEAMNESGNLAEDASKARTKKQRTPRKAGKSPQKPGTRQL
jgi:hypothetical protein